MRKKRQLPEQGNVFVFRHEDGRYSACRVIHTRKTSPCDPGYDCVLVACCDWIGSNVPDLEEPGLRKILNLTHHSYDNEPALAWISEPVPANFIPIGSVSLPQDEAEIRCSRMSDWVLFPLQVFAQWEWENDPESVRRKDAAHEEERLRKAQEQKGQRDAFLESMSLDTLLEYEFFASWKRFPSKKMIKASREIMHATVKKLHNNGMALTGISKVRVLKSCIDQFNRLDSKYEFIETVLREDICAEFEVIAHACGLGQHKNLADRWRDW